MREWKKIFHANGNQKEADIAILISDKIDLKIKSITRDKGGHYIMLKGSIQEEDITIVNIYAPNIGAPQYIRQTLTVIKGEIERVAQREKTQINRTRNEKGEVTTDTAEIERIMRDYYKQLYANKMDNLKEMDKFLESTTF